MNIDPLAAPSPRNTERDPFDSNQAIPSLIFGRYRAEFRRRFPEFSVVYKRHLSLFAYPLSGGFQRWSLVSERAAGFLLKVEDRIERSVGPLMGFRLLVALAYRSPN